MKKCYYWYDIKNNCNSEYLNKENFITLLIILLKITILIPVINTDYILEDMIKSNISE